MGDASVHQRGLYFEEFEVGKTVRTAGRTVTEADIVNFAGVSGDFNNIHTDAVFSAQTPFGERIAHGLLVLSIVSGLTVQTGFMEGTVIAWREIKDWKFSRNVNIGDTVSAEMEILQTKPLPRLGGGSVTAEVRVYNQKDEVVMRGSWVVLVRNKDG